jgi:hypothetical protein
MPFKYLDTGHRRAKNDTKFGASKILAPQGPSPKKLQFLQDRRFPEILRGRDVPGLVERII